MKIVKPTLLLDKEKCLRNIKRMHQKAKQHNLVFRPHFKTHQSDEVGNWFKDYGIDKTTVSSVDMARYFAKKGFRDITLAFPVNMLEIDKINSLAPYINLNLLLESENVAGFLEKKLNYEAGVFIKIDTGYHRTGIPAEDPGKITRIISKITEAKKLSFKGFLVHSGNTYDAKSKEEVAEIHFNSIEKLQQLKNNFLPQYPDMIISIGDTPSCSMMDDFTGVDEIRPGNFVFYDVMQAEIGSCSYEDVAVALVCPVVAKHKERNEIVIFGGAVHLSKDFIEKGGVSIYGLIANFDGKQWGQPLENTYIKKLSQEHGIIKTTPGQIENIREGDLLAVLPVHSCLTVDAIQKVFTIV